MAAKAINNKGYYDDWSEAVSQDLQQLAVLHDREADAALIDALREVNFPHNLGFQVEALDDKDGKGSYSAQKIVETALNKLPEKLDQEALDWLAVDYADIYLNHSLHASPFESVWLDEDHLIQQEPMFKVRDWYKLYGVESKDWRVRSDDHIVLQLQFLALLLNPDSTFPKAIPLDKRMQECCHFLDEHLLLWLANFSQLVVQRAGSEFYASIALLTHAYVDQLRDALAEITDIDRPTEEENEKRRKANNITMAEVPVKFVPGVAESW